LHCCLLWRKNSNNFLFCSPTNPIFWRTSSDLLFGRPYVETPFSRRYN
jgi:hypothetical protein